MRAIMMTSNWIVETKMYISNPKSIIVFNYDYRTEPNKIVMYLMNIKDNRHRKSYSLIGQWKIKPKQK